MDVFALGCTMYTLMFHRPPFPENETLTRLNGNFRIPAEPKYSDFAMKLLKSMLAPEPTVRMSSRQVFEATRNVVDIMQKSMPMPKFEETPECVEDKDDSNMFRSHV